MLSFPNVTADAKANVYFDGNVVSHTIHLTDGSRKTLGLIRPGNYHFGTEAAERMDIVAGSCTVVIDGSTQASTFPAGSTFVVEANSGFTITVADGLCEYVCSFLEG